MRCTFCDQPIERNNDWKGTADRFDRSEFVPILSALILLVSNL
jgi:hypothetical protein